MKREQIETLAINNIVRIYKLVGTKYPTGFPIMGIQDWRDLIQMKLTNSTGCSDIIKTIQYATTVDTVRQKYTEKFLNFIISFLNIRISKINSSEDGVISITDSKICDKINNEEIERLSRCFNKHRSRKTLLPYELYEIYGLEKLTKEISTALNKDVEIEMISSFIPKDYRVQTKDLEENIWVFVPTLPQIVVKLKC